MQLHRGLSVSIPYHYKTSLNQLTRAQILELGGRRGQPGKIPTVRWQRDLPLRKRRPHPQRTFNRSPNPRPLPTTLAPTRNRRRLRNKRSFQKPNRESRPILPRRTRRQYNPDVKPARLQPPLSETRSHNGPLTNVRELHVHRGSSHPKQNHLGPTG